MLLTLVSNKFNRTFYCKEIFQCFGLFSFIKNKERSGKWKYFTGFFINLRNASLSSAIWKIFLISSDIQVLRVYRDSSTPATNYSTAFVTMRFPMIIGSFHTVSNHGTFCVYQILGLTFQSALLSRCFILLCDREFLIEMF